MEFLESLIEVAILLLCSAFFSGAETALMSLSTSQVARMQRGSGIERIIYSLLQNTKRLLSVILVGNMFVNVLLTSFCASLLSLICVGTATFPGLFEVTVGNAVKWLGISVSPETMDSVSDAFSALVNVMLVTPLLMIFGELTPKTLAMGCGQTFARIAALPIKYLSKILAPAVWLLEKVCGFIQRLLGIADAEMVLDRSEIAAVLAGSEKSGATSHSERRLIERLIRFSSYKARDVMVPLRDEDCIADSLTVQQAYAASRKIPAEYVPIRNSDKQVWGSICFADYYCWSLSDLAGKRLADLAGLDPSVQTPIQPIVHVDADEPLQRVVHRLGRCAGGLAIVQEKGQCIGTVSTARLLPIVAGAHEEVK